MSILLDAFEWIKRHGASADKYATDIFGRQRFDGELLQEPALHTIKSRTLGSIMDYVANGMVGRDGLAIDNLFVHIANPQTVYLVEGAAKSANKDRLTPLMAVAPEYRHKWGADLELSDAIIYLRTCYQPSEELDALVRTLSCVTGESSFEISDDGLSQDVVIKQSVTSKSKTAVKAIVTLRPYRTFAEIDQPEMRFMLRLTKPKEAPVAARLIPIEDGGTVEITRLASVSPKLSRAW